MSAPLFSIVTPTHNRANLLPNAIKSVLAQTHPDWELVIVDDGSTDETKRVVAAFTDPRIRYHYQENRQLNGARNTGVRLAAGRYICLLDDDDHFLPNHLEILEAAMREDEFRHDIYRSGEILMGGKKPVYCPNYDNDQDILPQYWKHVTGMFGMAIRGELMREHAFDEELLLLDDFIWLNERLVSASLHQLDAHTAVVRLHDAQRSATYHTVENMRKNVQQLARAYSFPGVAERVDFRLYHQQVLHQYMHCCRQLCRGGLRLQALKIWREGTSYATAEDWRDVARTLAMITTGK